MDTLLAKKGKRLLQIPNDYTVVDIETTGFKIGDDSIIEIAALKIRAGKTTDEYNTLIYKAEALSPTITKLTGITKEMLLAGIPIEKAMNDFLDFLGDDIILGHNVDFDIGFLSLEAEKMSKALCNDYVDTLYISKTIFPNVSHKLSDLVKMLGIDEGAHHRALADCYHTYRLADKITKGEFDIVAVPPSPKPKVQYLPSDKTKAINKLNGILIGILCDDFLSDSELLALNSWLKDNDYLSGNYPFDIIYTSVNKVLEDGIIDEGERNYLFNLFKKISDPLEYTENKLSIDDLKNKIVCLSGDFINCSKAEFANTLIDLGAIVKDTVTRKTEILIVGGNGSEQWSCGNYGNKVKKALELQEQGNSIVILKECDIRK